MSTTRPIGYWLKHLDNLLERQIDATLAGPGLGLGRRHWQVLNTLNTPNTPDGGPPTTGELRQTLAPFWTDAGPGLDEVLEGDDGLRARGWIRTPAPGGGWELTERGRAAHAEAAGRIAETRALVMEGLTREEYAETVRVLAVMAANVEARLGPRSDQPAPERVPSRKERTAVAKASGSSA